MKRKLRAVLPITFKGKILVFLLKTACWGISPFVAEKWSKPIQNFEENPLFYSSKDIIYFGYKYYFKPPYKYDTSLVSYFQNQKIEFNTSETLDDVSEITISIGGDLMPYEWIKKEYTKHLWDDVGNYFFNSDIVFANLETPINLKKPPSLVPEVMISDLKFNASEDNFRVFNGNGKYKGFDILSTANNHSFDLGEEGILETIRFLKSKNIVHVGTSAEKSNGVKIIEKNGINVAFIAYTYSLNTVDTPKEKSYLVNHLRLNKKGVDLTRIKEDVRIAYQKGADFVFLSLHTGNAYQEYPSAHTVEIYHRIFEECGVDAILGGHPHNPQPMEKYKFKCPITGEKKEGFAIYSLADFVAYDIFTWGRLFPLLKIHLKKGVEEKGIKTKISKIDIMPVYNWGTKKNHKTQKELRFLQLEPLMQKIRQGNIPDFMDKKSLEEIEVLYSFWQKNFENQLGE